MNQILDFGTNGNNDYNEKNKKIVKNNKPDKNVFEGGINYGEKSKSTSSISDKVVKVFAILMVALAIALIVSGATSILKNKKDTAEPDSKLASNPQVEAEILTELDEEEGKVKIIVNSSVGINQMNYSWDQEHDNVVAGAKQTTLEENIPVPYGEHVLHVQVIDEQNNKTMKDFDIASSVGIDTVQPEISLTITEQKKLLITAIDDTSIAYVTYTWNDGETVKMMPETEGLKEYEFEIDILKGKNTIVVSAVDGADEPHATTVSKVLEGVMNPVIKYEFLDSTGAVLKIMCSHENGIKKIYYTLNEQPYQWELAEGEDAPTYLEFTQNSVPGINSMTITVTSVDDTEAEFNPQWEYGTSNESTSETPVE